MISMLQNENQDDEFLLSRVLFLTTYETTLNFDHLCDGHNLVENINAVSFSAKFDCRPRC